MKGGLTMARYYIYTNKRKSKCDGCKTWITEGQEVYSNSTGVYHKDCDFIGIERNQGII